MYLIIKPMKYLILVFLFFFSLTLYAQVTYTSEDYATAGDQFVLSQANIDPIGLDFSITGENMNWNYSTLTIQDQREIEALTPGETGYQIPYVATCTFEGNNPFTCLSQWNELSDFGIRDLESLSLGGFEFSNVVRHFRKTGSTLEETILGVQFGTGGVALPLAIEYGDRDTVYQFPLIYQKKDSSYGSWAVDFTEQGAPFSFSRNLKRVNEVEGWGSLQTPFGTFANTLKMKTLIRSQDTLETQGTAIPIPSTQVVYSWFAPEIAWPVLVATGNVVGGAEVITNISFIDTLRCLEPNASFFPFPPVALYNEDTQEANISFTNTSGNASTYTWEFGDGGTANGESPSHTYTEPGVYPVTLIACNTVCEPPQCDTTTFQLLIANPNTTLANFVITPARGICLGDTARFSNVSINAENYAWDFGDGSFSEEMSPTHVYISPGSYEVQLVASQGNTTDTARQTIEVFALPEPDLGPDQIITPEESITLTPGTFSTYSWSNGSSQAELTLLGSELGEGIFPYVVTVTDTNQCQASDTLLLTVSLSTSILGTLPASLIHIYPNPTHEVLFIEFESSTVPLGAISIQDLQGRQLSIQSISPTQQVQRIEVTSLPRGIYIWRVAVNEGEFMGLFEKK